MATLVCRVELSKEKGITVTVENADGKITQTLHMDGTAITTEVKGESETSTITQKADSIAIKCKTYTLDAETITCKSSKDSVYESQAKYTAKSTQDMTLSSQANLAQEATRDVSIKGLNLTLEAQSAWKASGLTAELKAKGGAAKVEGVQLALAGQAQAELKGAMVSVKADGMLTAEASGVATLKGSITNVSGNLVKLG